MVRKKTFIFLVWRALACYMTLYDYMYLSDMISVGFSLLLLLLFAQVQKPPKSRHHCSRQEDTKWHSGRTRYCGPSVKLLSQPRSVLWKRWVAVTCPAISNLYKRIKIIVWRVVSQYLGVYLHWEADVKHWRPLQSDVQEALSKNEINGSFRSILLWLVKYFRVLFVQDGEVVFSKTIIRHDKCYKEQAFD